MFKKAIVVRVVSGDRGGTWFGGVVRVDRVSRSRARGLPRAVRYATVDELEEDARRRDRRNARWKREQREW